MLQKFEQLVDKSGSMSLKIDLNFVCRLHCRKSGCLLEADKGIFATMLKKKMCSE